MTERVGKPSLLAALALTSLAAGVRADEPPRARPESLGFSAARLDYIDRYFTEKVQRNEMAGIVVLIARHGKLAHFSAIGYADLGEKRKMEADTIFRLYSMTKPISATALMMLYEEGAFQLDDPISKYLPEFKGVRVLRTPDSALTDTVAAMREPTIHDLFRHTAGLTHGIGADAVDRAYVAAGLFSLDTSLAEMVTALAKIPLRYQPGTKVEYSISQDVQARLVELLSGMPFDQFLRRRIFEPLGMKDTGYWVKDPSRLASMHWIKDGKLVPCDDVHGCRPADNFLGDPQNVNSYTSWHAHMGGSYGLVGTAEDYWRFAQMMLNGGELNGHRLLSPSTVRYMARDHLGSVSIQLVGMGWGLGFAVVKDAADAGYVIPDGSVYWAGVANTLFWIDPKNDIVIVAMTQSMDPTTESWLTLRGQIAAMVYGALIE